MSTWTSKAAAAGLVLLLGGCVGLTTGSAPRQVAVAQGRVIVAGPSGYCIDTQGSHDDSHGDFVLLGSCRALSGQLQAPHPRDAAVLTATVSAFADGTHIAGAGRELAAYFRSKAGRAALSHSGEAKTVVIQSAGSSDGAFFLHLTDSAMFPHAAPARIWRTLFDLNGHIVTLSVMALPDKPLDDAAARALLRRFIATVKAASPQLIRLQMPRARPKAA